MQALGEKWFVGDAVMGPPELPHSSPDRLSHDTRDLGIGRSENEIAKSRGAAKLHWSAMIAISLSHLEQHEYQSNDESHTTGKTAERSESVIKPPRTGVRVHNNLVGRISLEANVPEVSKAHIRLRYVFGRNAILA
jgi:hypothetical protein